MREDRPMPTHLTHLAPECPYATLLLFAMRRMAAGGLQDAFAAQAMFSGFGMGFRRPLILLRAFMAEVARVSSVKIAVAPCCCRRMTEGESALLTAIAGAMRAPNTTHEALCTVLHVRACLGLVTSAQAVATAFADQGMPLAARKD